MGGRNTGLGRRHDVVFAFVYMLFLWEISGDTEKKDSQKDQVFIFCIGSVLSFGNHREKASLAETPVLRCLRRR